MEFVIEFYKTRGGDRPVKDFLEDLKRSNPSDFATVLKGLHRLKDKRNHKEPLSKPIGQGLFELRHVGKLNTRVIWFFAKGRRIITVHGIRNNGQKIKKQDIATALARKQDWEERQDG